MKSSLDPFGLMVYDPKTRTVRTPFPPDKPKEPKEPEEKTMATVEGKNDVYEVGKVVAENERYRLRLCTNSKGKELMLQVSMGPEHNGEVGRNAWMLTKLREAARVLEERFAKKGTDKRLNYELGFSKIWDTFMLKGGRQVSIIGLRDIVKVSSAIPVVKLWKDSLRVDLRTSAWMMGKLLKTMTFAHDNRYQIGNVSSELSKIKCETFRQFIFLMKQHIELVDDPHLAPQFKF